jgi:hypothetical protein
MPDWRKLVSDHLAALPLGTSEKEEVIDELTAHLEESYQAFRGQGLTESQAARQSLEHVSNWHVLRRRIVASKRREHFMKERMHQLWIPGLVTLILSMALLAALQKQGFSPRLLGHGPRAVLFHLPWMLTLPFFGALGAYLSSRAGASRPSALLASVFPVLALTTAFLLMFPIGFLIERISGNHVDFAVVAAALLTDGIGWLLLPGFALLAGGLLAQLFFAAKARAQRGVA